MTTKTQNQTPGKLCWAGYVTGQDHIEVMVRREGSSSHPMYVLYLDDRQVETFTTPTAAMDASKRFGYQNDGPTLESSLGG
jgi:hypothetical protein